MLKGFFSGVSSLVVLFFISLVFTIAAVAADLPVINPPSNDELLALFVAIGGLKGAGALAIAAVVVQGLMLLLKTKLGEAAGKWRLLIVYLLSIVTGVIALKATGVDLGAALVHSQTLAAVQVFLNQLFKQFFQKQE